MRTQAQEKVMLFTGEQMKQVRIYLQQLCFDENTEDILMYEILQQRIALCKKIEEVWLFILENVRLQKLLKME